MSTFFAPETKQLTTSNFTLSHVDGGYYIISPTSAFKGDRCKIHKFLFRIRGVRAIRI